MKKYAILCVILVFTLVLAGCSCNGNNSNEPQLSTTGTDVTQAPDVSKPPAAETTTVPGSSVELKSNAGTGYEWTCTVDNEAVVTSNVETLSGDTAVAGGELTTKITFTGVAEGATFAIVKLERVFEANSAVDLHVYKLKVDEALKVTVSEVEMPLAAMTVEGTGDVSVEVSSPSIIVYGGGLDEAGSSRTYHFTAVFPISGEVTFNFKDADGNVTGSTVYTVEFSADNVASATLKG